MKNVKEKKAKTKQRNNVIGTKAGKYIKAISEKGKVSKNDVKAILSEIVTFAGKEQKRLSKLVKSEAKKAINELAMISSQEGKLIKKRLKKLEESVRKKGLKIAEKLKKESVMDYTSFELFFV